MACAPFSNGARPQRRVCRTALACAVHSAVQQGCSACGDGAAAVTPPPSSDGWHGRWQQPCELQLDCGRRAGSRSRRAAAGGESGHRLKLLMGWGWWDCWVGMPGCACCKEDEDIVQSPSSLLPPQSQGAGRVVRTASAAVCRCVSICFVLSFVTCCVQTRVCRV